jgi:hypothetical protein
MLYLGCSPNCMFTYSLTMVLSSTRSVKNEHQLYILGRKGGRGVGLPTLQHSYADYLEIREPQLPGTLRACRNLHRYYFNLLTISKYYLKLSEFCINVLYEIGILLCLGNC